MKTNSTSFHEMSVENMEFAENAFDLVILPRERSYKAGFNLHVNHYQYEWEIQHLFNQVPGVSSSIELIDGDFYCNLVFAK
jgi:hypothetical protein